ncbi:MAG: serine/threonine-protein kinase [Pirellulaceae bacterium]|nr:serine/threonine protein kinase [Planctomycetales bacterium]
MNLPRNATSSPRPFPDPDELLEQFELSWQRGESPLIHNFAAQTAEIETIAELVKVDLEYQWRQHNPTSPPRTVEQYLSLLPQLANSDCAPLIDLVGEEYWVRQLWGDAPGHESYLQRFPHLTQQLSSLLPALDQRIQNEAASTHRADADQQYSKADSSLAAELPTIPGYQLLERLGAGGMGVVYLARELDPHRFVAIKFLHQSLHHDPQARERFEAEIQVAARLKYPHIVQLLSAGEHAGHRYCVYEYVAGGTLKDYLARATLSPQAAAELVSTLASTIDFAHQQKIAHRDLKPANVMLDVQGRGIHAPIHADQPPADEFTPHQHRPPANLQHATIKITDFGLAKQWAADRDDALTVTGSVLGTPAYMAPEQTTFGPLSTASTVDIYQLGVILYESLVGHAPFLGSTTIETLDMIRRDDPVPPRRIVASLPRDLETICLKCLRKQPHERYASAQQLHDDLQRFLRHEPVHARPSSHLERTIKWGRRRPAGMSAILALIILVLATIAGIASHNAVLRKEMARTEANRREAVHQRTIALETFNQGHETLLAMLQRTWQASRETDSATTRALRDDLLQQMLDHYRQISRESEPTDDQMRLFQTMLLVYSGQVQHYQEDYEGAIADFESARTVLDELHQAHPNDEEFAYSLAFCLFRWSSALRLRPAQSPADIPDSPTADSLLQEVLKIVELSRYEHVTRMRRLRARSYGDLARIASAEGNRRQAREFHRQAITLWPEVIASGDDLLNVLSIYADDVAGICFTESAAERVLAEREVEKLTSHLRPWLSSRVDNPEIQQAVTSLANAHFQLGESAKHHNDRELASHEYLMARTRIEQALTTDFPSRDACVVAAAIAVSQADFAEQHNDIAVAIGHFRFAQRVAPDPVFREHIEARILVLERRLQSTDSQLADRQLSSADTNVAAAPSPTSVTNLWNLATEKLAKGEILESEKLLTTAISQVAAPDSRNVDRATLYGLYWSRAGVYRQLGDFDKSVADWDSALQLADGDIAPTVIARSRTLLDAQQIDEALHDVDSIPQVESRPAGIELDFAIFYAQAAQAIDQQRNVVLNSATNIAPQRLAQWQALRTHCRHQAVDSLRLAYEGPSFATPAQRQQLHLLPLNVFENDREYREFVRELGEDGQVNAVDAQSR